MAKYRYVGAAPGSIAGTPYVFSSYGQSIDISEELVAEHIGRMPLLSEKDFEALNFSKEDLKKYSRFETHPQLSHEFETKMRKGWAKLHDIRTIKVDKVEVNNG